MHQTSFKWYSGHELWKKVTHCRIIKWQVWVRLNKTPIMGVHWSAGLRDNLSCCAKITSYNPGQKSLGQYCNIHIFLSFLGSLLKQCILFKIFLHFSLPPLHPIQSWNLEKILDTCVQHCLWGDHEGSSWTCANWKTPQKCKVSQDFCPWL